MDYYRWKKSSSHIGKGKGRFTADLQNFPDPTTQNFFLLGELGVGSNASVLLACSSASGRVCALKCYHVKPSHQSTNDAREVEETIDVLRAIASKEATLWKAIYGKRFPCTNQADLGGSPCLAIPYGVPVADRESYVEAVHDELMKFAQLGYRYDNND